MQIVSLKSKFAAIFIEEAFSEPHEHILFLGRYLFCFFYSGSTEGEVICICFAVVFRFPPVQTDALYSLRFIHALLP